MKGTVPPIGVSKLSGLGRLGHDATDRSERALLPMPAYVATAKAPISHLPALQVEVLRRTTGPAASLGHRRTNRANHRASQS